MDPNACYNRFLKAIRANEISEALFAHDDLTRWLINGGFEPDWSENQRLGFTLWRERFRHTRLDALGDIPGDRAALIQSFIDLGADSEAVSAISRLTVPEIASLGLFVADYGQRLLAEAKKP